MTDDIRVRSSLRPTEDRWCPRHEKETPHYWGGTRWICIPCEEREEEREIERKEREALEEAIHGLPRRADMSDEDKVWAYDRLHRTLKGYLRHAVKHGYWADDSNELLVDAMILGVMGDEGAEQVWEIIEKVETR